MRLIPTAACGSEGFRDLPSWCIRLFRPGEGPFRTRTGDFGAHDRYRSPDVRYVRATAFALMTNCGALGAAGSAFENEPVVPSSCCPSSFSSDQGRRGTADSKGCRACIELVHFLVRLSSVKLTLGASGFVGTSFPTPYPVCSFRSSSSSSTSSSSMIRRTSPSLQGTGVVRHAPVHPSSFFRTSVRT